jgi:hypothetical protein
MTDALETEPKVVNKESPGGIVRMNMSKQMLVVTLKEKKVKHK